MTEVKTKMSFWAKLKWLFKKQEPAKVIYRIKEVREVAKVEEAPLGPEDEEWAEAICQIKGTVNYMRTHASNPKERMCRLECAVGQLLKDTYDI